MLSKLEKAKGRIDLENVPEAGSIDEELSGRSVSAGDDSERYNHAAGTERRDFYEGGSRQ